MKKCLITGCAEVFLLVLMISAVCILTGCNSIKHSSKFGLTEGFYKSRLDGKKMKTVYLIPGEDSIVMYLAGRRSQVVDSTKAFKLAFPAVEKAGSLHTYKFHQNTLDIDILTILLKYRPAVKGFPNQLNTSILNGALYLGYRTDLYHLQYKQTLFRKYKRDITHYGFSLGLFTGIGASRIDEYVTLNALNIQYDGFVNPSGIAAIIAVDKLTVGLTFGEDHLLDKNRKLWIYQGKPWIGLSVGLNLN